MPVSPAFVTLTQVSSLLADTGLGKWLALTHRVALQRTLRRAIGLVSLLKRQCCLPFSTRSRRPTRSFAHLF